MALNILYQVDVAGLHIEDAIQAAMENVSAVQEAKEYAEILARGVRMLVHSIDPAISELSPEWPIERQPSVDRNILRMAIFEIDNIDFVPPIVTINEAVELAKKYSTEDSGKFVNGVLAEYLRLKKSTEEDINNNARTDT